MTSRNRPLPVALLALSFGAAVLPARAQVVVGDPIEANVEVDYGALESLPQTGNAPGRVVRLHEPRSFKQAGDQIVQYDADYDSSLIVDSTGETRMPITRTALVMPSRTSSIMESPLPLRDLDAPQGSTAASGMSTQDLNHMEVVNSGQASMPAIPVAETVASAPVTSVLPSSAPTQLAPMPAAPPVAEDVPQSLGPAAIPAPVPMMAPPVPAAGAGETGRPASPRPVVTPPAAQIASEPVPPPPSLAAPSIPMPPAPIPVRAAPQQMAAVTAPPAPVASQAASADDLRVDFKPGEEAIDPGQAPRLDRLVARLNSNPDLRVELRSFATGGADMASKARRVSLSRALTVKAYLTQHGITDNRIDVRALGAATAGQETTAGSPGDRVDMFLMR